MLALCLKTFVRSDQFIQMIDFICYGTAMIHITVCRSCNTYDYDSDRTPSVALRSVTAGVYLLTSSQAKLAVDAISGMETKAYHMILSLMDLAHTVSAQCASLTDRQHSRSNR